jgi:uncharacterized protein YndB with AHSA1/START domain
VRSFSIAIDVAAPPERVWQVMSDVERWHEWTPSISSVKLRGPLGVGTTAVIRQPKFPPAWWKITEIQPGTSFKWVSTGPGFRVVALHSVRPIAGGARATLSLELQGLLGGIFGRITKDITERYIALEAKGLKARSENPAFRHDQAA